MRPRFLAAPVALALPFTVLLWMHGCSTEASEVENLCGWLGDPENCFIQFYRDVDPGCGTHGRGSARFGSFSGRDKLDQCFLVEGGIMVFDPPLDMAAFPPAAGKFT